MTQISLALDKLNELIKICIYYGGDRGGPYFNDDDFFKLCDLIDSLCDSIPGLDCDFDGDIPRFFVDYQL